MFSNTSKTNDRGFSLIEMVIVVMIIGILTLFATLWLPGSVDQAKVDKTRLLMDQVIKACRSYAFDNGGNYPEKVKNLWPKYIKELPKSPWGDPIEISLGKRTEVFCVIKWGNSTRRLSLPIDTLGFSNDNKVNLGALGKSAFSIAKTSSTAVSGEVNLFFVTLDIDFSTVSTPKFPELGSDFRFFIDNAEITGANSQAGVPITLSSLGGQPNTGFEYTSSYGSDRITVTMKNCKRSTNFTMQIYRPGDDGIPIFYGEKKIIEVAPGSSIPITLTRLVAESTNAK